MIHVRTFPVVTVILKGNIAFYKSNFCCTAFSALMHTYTFSWDCTYCLENETPELCAGLWSNLVEALYFGIIPCMSYFFLKYKIIFFKEKRSKSRHHLYSVNT